MKTAATYIRVSTEDQIEYSPDSQLKAVQNYAKAHDMILPEEFIFVDEGISGRKAEKRPAFQKMIGTAKLKPKPFDVILLWKFSRFARNREDSIVYKSMLRKQCGIEVISISEQLSEDKTSILIEALIEAMDEYYSLNLAEEVRRGMAEKFSRGGVVSQPPYGYKMGDGVFVPDPVTTPIVRMMFADRLSGMSTRQIALKLNNMGIKTNKGNPFENRTVEYILTNQTYIGKLRRSKDGKAISERYRVTPDKLILVDGKHEPIIDVDAFEQVQKIINDTKKLYSQKYTRQEPASYMLKGLVKCDNCGGTLTLSVGHQHLQCHHYAKGACTVSHSVKITKLNAALMEQLRSDCERGIFFAAVSPTPSKKSGTENIAEALLEKEKKKLDRVKEAYENGIDTLEEYKANKARITAKIEELAKNVGQSEPLTVQEINRIISGRVKKGLEVLENPDISEATKNTTLRGFLEYIIYRKPEETIEVVYKY